MSLLIELVGSALIVLGAALLMLAALGVLTLPDALSRQHAATKAGIIAMTKTWARELGRVSVADLATRFGVTAETIRRDLDALARDGLLSRVHGGAVPPDKLPRGEASVGAREETRKLLRRIRKDGARALIYEDVPVRCGEGHHLELHLDMEEANAGAIQNGELLEIVGIERKP